MGSQLLHFRPKTEVLTYQSAQEIFFLRGKVEGLSAKTIRGYEYVLKSLANFLAENNWGPDLPLTELDHHLLREYFLALQARGLSKVSIATHHRSLKAFFGFLVKESNLKENPMLKISPPRTP